MKDLDQRLLEGLRELANEAEPPPGLYERARNRMLGYRRRVRIGAALVAAATLVAAVSVLPVVSRRARVGGQPTPGATVVNAAVGHWEPLPASPLVLDRGGPALSVWTGSEMLTWSQRDAVGARYDPATRRWRRLAEGPLEPRQGATAVWTGREMLVWGGVDGDRVAGDPGAAYDPRTDSWRRLPRPPIRPRGRHTAVWTGNVMLVWGGTAGVPRAPAFSDGAAYDPAADRWQRLVQAPLLRRSGHSAVWTGREMVVWGGQEAHTPVAYFADGAAYDPASQTWRAMPPSPLSARRGHTAIWAEERMLLWGGDGQSGHEADGAAWDPFTGGWTELPVAPLAPRSAHTAVWSGTEMLVWGGAGAGRRRFADGAAYRPAVAAWRRLPGVLLAPRFGHAATWTGTAMLVWGGDAPRDPPLADGGAFAYGRMSRPKATGGGFSIDDEDAGDRQAAALGRACQDARGVEPAPDDVEHFVDAFVRLRTIGSGAEDCLSGAALRAYRPESSARANRAADPARLCLYECGSAVVVGVRREGNWLEGSPDGTYTATLTIVLEQQRSTDDVAELTAREVLTLGPGKTWAGRPSRLVVLRATAADGAD